MASVNKVMICGNLGQDPELKNTQSGMAVVNMSVATTSYQNDAAGAKRELTEWHRVTVWDKQAENCNKFLKKGSKVFVEGRIQTRSWEKDGVKQYSTEIVASNVQFMDAKPKEDKQGAAPNKPW